MGIVTNRISVGEYKNSDIKLKGLRADKPVLICRGLLGKNEIVMDKSNIRAIHHETISHAEHKLEITWKNGKTSMALVDNSTYAAICAKML